MTCLITAYNVERFVGRAIESALAQDWPAESLEVVVVDDGSTDGTAAEVARFGERVRRVSKENGGLVSATNAGLEAAGGDVIAILDGDDMWPAGKLRRQVGVLMERPELGLVHGDMDVIDADDRVVHPSFFAQQGMDPPRGRVLGRLLAGNFVSGGSSVFRASLLDRIGPIPPESPFADWWIAARVAEVAEIDHVDAPMNHYRLHGENMGLGASGEKLYRALTADLAWQRWMLQSLDVSGVPPHELAAACRAILAKAAWVAERRGVDVHELMPVSLEQRAAAATKGIDPVLAFALDPWNEAAREGLALVAPEVRAAPQLDARSFVVLAFGEELAAEPGMLAAWAGRFSGDDDVTLLIQAPPDEAAAIGCALDQGETTADMALYPCGDPADLAGAVSAVYTRRLLNGAFTGLPRVSDAHAGELQTLAWRRGAVVLPHGARV